MRLISKTIFVLTFLILMAVSCRNSSQDTAGNEDVSKFDTLSEIDSSANNLYADKNLKKELDLLIDRIGDIGASPFLTSLLSDDTFAKDRGLMKRPDYLMPLSRANQAVSIGAKYRAAVIYKTDMIVASLYHEPLTDYKQTIARLLVDINNPGFNINLNESHRRSTKAVKNMVNELFNEAYKQRSANLFWEAAATAVIEELFLLSNNTEVIPMFLNDSQVNDIFNRISLIYSGINLSSDNHPELAQTKELIEDILLLKSNTTTQLQKKLLENKERLAIVRNSLI